MKKIVLPMMAFVMLIVTSIALTGCVDLFRVVPGQSASGERLTTPTFQIIESMAYDFGYDFDRYENIAIVTINDHAAVSFSRYHNTTFARQVLEEYFEDLRPYSPSYSIFHSGSNFQSYRTTIFGNIFVLYRVGEWVIVGAGFEEDSYAIEEFLGLIITPIAQPDTI